MIYVFKTSVKTKRAVKQVSPHLDSLPQTCYWNFDLDDCDKILRIDSQTEISQLVKKLLQDKGFDCKELPD